jgi:hypothetical protein
MLTREGSGADPSPAPLSFESGCMVMASVRDGTLVIDGIAEVDKSGN